MPVVATKLHLPEPRPDLVPRARLQRLLAPAESASVRLVLVSAPAGFGKTTVLTQWLGSRVAAGAVRVAWVSLDDADGEVRRFLTHVVAAVRSTDAAIGDEARTLLEAGGELPLEAVLTSLVNDLDLVAGPTVIALDDYHEVSAGAVHEVVGFLLDHLPRHVQIAVTTRSDPPLPLARLRSNGGLVELRAGDLRFSAEEAEALLNDVVGLPLSRASVDALDARTEGWAAGLRLAGLSLRGRTDVDAFVDDFTGSHRFVLDYLVEEVLGRQAPQVTDFLLTTSLLGSLSGSLCSAVTGRPDAPQVLDALVRDDVFVVPLDDRGEWFRYHHLFADALQVRLRASRPGDVADLHRAAGRWYAEHGFLDEAIRHTSAAGDTGRSAELVELAMPSLRRLRRDDALRALVLALPEEVVRRRPLAATWKAWTRLSEGDLDGVEEWLDVAEQVLGDDPGVPEELRAALPDAARERDDEVRQLPAMIAVYRAAVAQGRGDVGGTVDQAHRALGLTSPGDHFPRAAAAGFLGLAAWAAGDLATAVDTFGEAVASMRAAGSTTDAIGSTVVLAEMWLGRGRPDEARRRYERALAEAGRHPVPLSTTGDLHVGLAGVLCELDDLDAADAHLATARDLGDPASLPENRFRWYATSAAVLRARGDLDGALELLREAQARHQPGFFPDVRPLPAMVARVHLARGDGDDAAEWARTVGVRPEDPPTYLGEFDQLTLARLALAQGRGSDGHGLEPVRAMLDRVLAAATAAGRDGSVVEVLALRALVDAADGDRAAALRDLTDALTSGYPAGYRRLFLDEGAPMHDLLREVAATRSGEAAASAARLLALAVEERSRPGGRQEPGGEGLSEREVEVLRLLATDLTGPEIARRLFVSVNTLRTHTKHIFTKLGVNSRRAAVGRAAELGIL